MVKHHGENNGKTAWQKFAAVLYYTHKQEERRRMDILEHAYGYVRVSTNVQVKEGLGIEGQKEEIQK